MSTYAKQYEERVPLRGRFELKAAIASGLIAGGILYLLPQGIPWAGLSSGWHVVMGRPILHLGVMGTLTMHIAVALIYALILAWITEKYRGLQAVLVGALVSLPIYLVNYAIISVAFPHLIGGEGRVGAAHLLFSLFAVAVFKGITSQRQNRSSLLRDL